MATRRKAAVAGSFYPSDKSELVELIKESFLDKKYGPGEDLKTLNLEQRTLLGGVSPHAGYVYSGCAAAHTYLNLFKEKIPDTVIIFGTDHIGYGKIALLEDGEWETPLGNLEIDTELTKNILKTSNTIISDEKAFIGYPFGREHNIEVQLPFIKYCAIDKDVKIVPIVISTKKIDVLEKLSSDIASAIKSLNKDIVIIASSDMTHKQPRDILNPQKDLEEMRKMDEAVIDAFKEGNALNVLKTASKTSVCGPQTISSLILTCKKLDTNVKCKSLKYYMSYEKTGGTGPCEYSVGYFAGVIVK
jgi:AmmeMemoRadiSam system protein B